MRKRIPRCAQDKMRKSTRQDEQHIKCANESEMYKHKGKHEERTIS